MTATAIPTLTNGLKQDPYRQRSTAGAGAAQADPAAAERAFTATYAAYQQRVFYHLYRLSNGNRELAQDLTTDVFVKAWRAWDAFEPRATLSWLLRIAQRVYLDWWRHDHVVRVRPWTALLAASADNDSIAAYSGDHAAETWPSAQFVFSGRLGESTDDAQPELEALSTEGVAEIRRLLEALAPRQALALRLRVEEGLSYDEIAARMSTTLSAIKSLLHNSRMAVRRRLQQLQQLQQEGAHL